MKVVKVADIVGGSVVYSDRGCARARITPMEFVGVLAKLSATAKPRDPTGWWMDVTVDSGSLKKVIRLPFKPVIGEADSLDTPLFIHARGLVFFRDRLFLAERPPMSEAERDEIRLRVKKAVYDEEADLASVKAAVANLEAAIEYTRTGPRRDPIPEDVKLLVWSRDGGACVRCGSKTKLHFDHIIPVAKGGGNVEANIQVLCESCNLKKSDKIATS